MAVKTGVNGLTARQAWAHWPCRQNYPPGSGQVFSRPRMSGGPASTTPGHRSSAVGFGCGPTGRRFIRHTYTGMSRLPSSSSASSTRWKRCRLYSLSLHGVVSWHVTVKTLSMVNLQALSRICPPYQRVWELSVLGICTLHLIQRFHPIYRTVHQCRIRIFCFFIPCPRSRGGGYCHHYVWPCVRVSFPDDISETVSRIAFILHTQIPQGV